MYNEYPEYVSAKSEANAVAILTVNFIALLTVFETAMSSLKNNSLIMLGPIGINLCVS